MIDPNDNAISCQHLHFELWPGPHSDKCVELPPVTDEARAAHKAEMEADWRRYLESKRDYRRRQDGLEN